VEPLLQNVTIPSNFLHKTYLGMCAQDYNGGCSGPEGQISDFNVWDRALTEEEMVDWTTCRFVE
jgi:hypothetical protein